MNNKRFFAGRGAMIVNGQLSLSLLNHSCRLLIVSSQHGLDFDDAVHVEETVSRATLVKLTLFQLHPTNTGISGER